VAVAFKGQDVRGDAVEEPAVVRNHDHAAREREQRLFERAQRVHVQIVRRFVEQQQVAVLLQQLGEVAGDCAGRPDSVPTSLLLIAAP
jgi:hypothetical protein